MKPLGLYGTHALSCRCGQGVLRVHAGVQDVLAGACRAAGLLTRKEVVVPMWAEWRQDGSSDEWLCVEAALDVQALDVARGICLHIDATVQNPFANSLAKT